MDVGNRVGIPLIARATWRMHVRPGPVVQIKVDLLDAEILKRFVEGWRDILWAHVAVPEFSGNEQIVRRRDIAFTDGLPDSLANDTFIFIGASGIEVPPPETDGFERGALHQSLGPIGMKCAISCDRHFPSCGERNAADIFW